MDDNPQYGPAFAALDERRQKFVLAMVVSPFASHADWARMAGYSDASEGCKVQAHHLLQDDRIKAAALEVSGDRLAAIGPALATEVMLATARSPRNKNRLRAAEMIANRVGLHETQEIHVKHTDLTGEALMTRLAAVAERLGLDAQKLIGGNVKVIEGKAVEVKSE